MLQLRGFGFSLQQLTRARTIETEQVQALHDVEVLARMTGSIGARAMETL